MQPLKGAKQSTAGTTRRQEEVDGLSGGWKCSRRGVGTAGDQEAQRKRRRKEEGRP